MGSNITSFRSPTDVELHDPDLFAGYLQELPAEVFALQEVQSLYDLTLDADTFRQTNVYAEFTEALRHNEMGIDYSGALQKSAGRFGETASTYTQGMGTTATSADDTDAATDVEESTGTSATDALTQDEFVWLESLDPYPGTLTDDDLLPVLQDAMLFEAYVKIHHLELAFMTEAGEIFCPAEVLSDPSPSDAFYEILYATYDIEGQSWQQPTHTEWASASADRKTDSLATQQANGSAIDANVDDRIGVVYQPFTFSLTDSEFLRWFYDGCAKIGALLPDGSLSVRRADLAAALANGVFNTVRLSEMQVQELLAMFPEARIEFAPDGKIVAGLRHDFKSQATDATLRGWTEEFFRCLGLDGKSSSQVNLGDGLNYARDKVTSRGTDEDGLRTLFTEIAKAGPQRIEQFKHAVEIDFKAIQTVMDFSWESPYAHRGMSFDELLRNDMGEGFYDELMRILAWGEKQLTKFSTTAGDAENTLFYGDFNFALNDGHFLRWLFDGCARFGTWQEDGTLVVEREAFMAAIIDKQFNGVALSGAQVEFLEKMFVGETIVFNAQGKIIDGISTAVEIQAPSEQMKMWVESFFSLCHNFKISSHFGPDALFNWAAERVYDYGTNEEGLEILFREIAKSGPDAVRQFKLCVETNFKSISAWEGMGQNFDAVLASEVSGRWLGRLRTILTAAERGKDYYIGQAYGHLNQVAQDLQMAMAYAGAAPASGGGGGNAPDTKQLVSLLTTSNNHYFKYAKEIVAEELRKEGAMPAEGLSDEAYAQIIRNLAEKQQVQALGLILLQAITGRVVDRAGDFAAQLGIDPDQAKNLHPKILIALIASTVAESVKDQVDGWERTSANAAGRADGLRTASDRSYFDTAYARMEAARQNIILHIENPEAITDDMLGNLNESLGDIYREFDIYDASEKEGMAALQSSAEAAEMATYIAIGTVIATFTGGAGMAYFAGVAAGGGALSLSTVIAGAGIVAAGEAGASAIVGGMAVGLAAGTAVETGAKYYVATELKHEEVSWDQLGDMAYSSAIDSGGAVLSLGVGAGIGAGARSLNVAVAAYQATGFASGVAATELLGRVGYTGARVGAWALTNPVTRGVISNVTISVANGGIRGFEDYGVDSILVAGISGMLGGMISPSLRNQRLTEVAFEMGREVTEELAETQFDFGDNQGVTTEVFIQSFAGALAELAGSARGDTDSKAAMAFTALAMSTMVASGQPVAGTVSVDVLGKVWSVPVVTQFNANGSFTVVIPDGTYTNPKTKAVVEEALAIMMQSRAQTMIRELVPPPTAPGTPPPTSGNTDEGGGTGNVGREDVGREEGRGTRDVGREDEGRGNEGRRTRDEGGVDDRGDASVAPLAHGGEGSRASRETGEGEVNSFVLGSREMRGDGATIDLDANLSPTVDEATVRTAVAQHIVTGNEQAVHDFEGVQDEGREEGRGTRDVGREDEGRGDVGRTDEGRGDDQRPDTSDQIPGTNTGERTTRTIHEGSHDSVDAEILMAGDENDALDGGVVPSSHRLHTHPLPSSASNAASNISVADLAAAAVQSQKDVRDLMTRARENPGVAQTHTIALAALFKDGRPVVDDNGILVMTQDGDVVTQTISVSYQDGQYAFAVDASEVASKISPEVAREVRTRQLAVIASAVGWSNQQGRAARERARVLLEHEAAARAESARPDTVAVQNPQAVVNPNTANNVIRFDAPRVARPDFEATQDHGQESEEGSQEGGDAGAQGFGEGQDERRGTRDEGREDEGRRTRDAGRVGDGDSDHDGEVDGEAIAFPDLSRQSVPNWMMESQGENKAAASHTEGLGEDILSWARGIRGDVDGLGRSALAGDEVALDSLLDLALREDEVGKRAFDELRRITRQDLRIAAALGQRRCAPLARFFSEFATARSPSRHQLELAGVLLRRAGFIGDILLNRHGLPPQTVADAFRFIYRCIDENLAGDANIQWIHTLREADSSWLARIPEAVRERAQTEYRKQQDARAARKPPDNRARELPRIQDISPRRGAAETRVEKLRGVLASVPRRFPDGLEQRVVRNSRYTIPLNAELKEVAKDKATMRLRYEEDLGAMTLKNYSSERTLYVIAQSGERFVVRKNETLTLQTGDLVISEDGAVNFRFTPSRNFTVTETKRDRPVAVAAAGVNQALADMAVDWQRTISIGTQRSAHIEFNRGRHLLIHRDFLGETRVTRRGREMTMRAFGEEYALREGDVVTLSDGSSFTYQEPQHVHQKPRSEFSPVLAGRDGRVRVIFGRANENLFNLTPGRVMEVFVARDKEKYVGKVEVFQDNTTGERVLRIIEETTGKIYVVSGWEILALRTRDSKRTSFISPAIATPQYADKSINQSGLDDSGMRVLVDYDDPRLQDFLTRHILSIQHDYAIGRLTKQQAAIRAWETIRKNIAYDHVRLYDKMENRLYSLGEFTEHGVCNERGMMLQIALQFIGIASKHEKGPFGGGRHAWVRLSELGINAIILDPQNDRILHPGEKGYDDYTPDPVTVHVRDRQMTHVGDFRAFSPGQLERATAHESWAAALQPAPPPPAGVKRSIVPKDVGRGTRDVGREDEGRGTRDVGREDEGRGAKDVGMQRGEFPVFRPGKTTMEGDLTAGRTESAFDLRLRAPEVLSEDQRDTLRSSNPDLLSRLDTALALARILQLNEEILQDEELPEVIIERVLAGLELTPQDRAMLELSLRTIISDARGIAQRLADIGRMESAHAMRARVEWVSQILGEDFSGDRSGMIDGHFPLDHIEEVEIMSGLGGLMPSHLVIVVHDDDFRRYMAGVSKPMAELGPLTLGLVKAHGVNTDAGHGNFTILPRSVVDHVYAQKSGMDVLVTHEEAHHLNKVIGLRDRALRHFAEAAQARDDGEDGVWMVQTSRGMIAGAQDEIVAYLTDPHRREDLRGLAALLTSPQNTYGNSLDNVWREIIEKLDTARNSRADPAQTALSRRRPELEAIYYQELEHFQQTVRRGITAAERIVQAPNGRLLLAQVPIEQWPDLERELQEAGVINAANMTRSAPASDAVAASEIVGPSLDADQRVDGMTQAGSENDAMPAPQTVSYKSWEDIDQALEQMLVDERLAWIESMHPENLMTRDEETDQWIMRDDVQEQVNWFWGSSEDAARVTHAFINFILGQASIEEEQLLQAFQMRLSLLRVAAGREKFLQENGLQSHLDQDFFANAPDHVMTFYSVGSAPDPWTALMPEGLEYTYLREGQAVWAIDVPIGQLDHVLGGSDGSFNRGRIHLNNTEGFNPHTYGLRCIGIVENGRVKFSPTEDSVIFGDIGMGETAGTDYASLQRSADETRQLPAWARRRIVIPAGATWDFSNSMQRVPDSSHPIYASYERFEAVLAEDGNSATADQTQPEILRGPPKTMMIDPDFMTRSAPGSNVPRTERTESAGVSVVPSAAERVQKLVARFPNDHLDFNSVGDRNGVRTVDAAAGASLAVGTGEGVVATKQQQLMTSGLYGCLGVLILGPNGNALLHMTPTKGLAYQPPRTAETLQQIKDRLTQAGDPANCRVVIVSNQMELDRDDQRHQELMAVRAAFEQAGYGNVTLVEAPMDQTTVFYSPDTPDQLHLVGYPYAPNESGRMRRGKQVRSLTVSMSKVTGGQAIVTLEAPDMSTRQAQVTQACIASEVSVQVLHYQPDAERFQSPHSQMKRILVLDYHDVMDQAGLDLKPAREVFDEQTPSSGRQLMVIEKNGERVFVVPTENDRNLLISMAQGDLQYNRKKSAEETTRKILTYEEFLTDPRFMTQSASGSDATTASQNVGPVLDTDQRADGMTQTGPENDAVEDEGRGAREVGGTDESARVAKFLAAASSPDWDPDQLRAQLGACSDAERQEIAVELFERAKNEHDDDDDNDFDAPPRSTLLLRQYVIPDLNLEGGRALAELLDEDSRQSPPSIHHLERRAMLELLIPRIMAALPMGSVAAVAMPEFMIDEVQGLGDRAGRNGMGYTPGHLRRFMPEAIDPRRREIGMRFFFFSHTENGQYTITNTNEYGMIIEHADGRRTFLSKPGEAANINEGDVIILAAGHPHGPLAAAIQFSSGFSPDAAVPLHPDITRDRAAIDQMLNSPDLRFRLEQQARRRWTEMTRELKPNDTLPPFEGGGEAKIEIDDEGNLYFISGETDREDLQIPVLEVGDEDVGREEGRGTKDEGREDEGRGVREIGASDEDHVTPEGRRLLGHWHGINTSTTPSTEDLVRLLQENRPSAHLITVLRVPGGMYEGRSFDESLRQAEIEAVVLECHDDGSITIDVSRLPPNRQNAMRVIFETRLQEARRLLVTTTISGLRTLASTSTVKISDVMAVAARHGYSAGSDAAAALEAYLRAEVEHGGLVSYEDFLANNGALIPDAERLQRVMGRYDSLDEFTRAAQDRAEVRAYIVLSECDLPGVDINEAMRRAHLLAPSLLTLPGEARALSLVDVRFIADSRIRYWKMADDKPDADTAHAAELVSEVYRGLVVVDTSADLMVNGVRTTYSQQYSGLVQPSVDDVFMQPQRTVTQGIPTIDHHGPYAAYPDGTPDPRNSTMKLLDILEAALQRAEGNVDVAIAQLNITGISTDNMGDGMWCVWIARNQARVMRDPALRALIRQATQFEDFDAFGSTYQRDNPDNPGIELQAALFRGFDQIYHNNHDALLALGFEGSDRMPALLPDEACAHIDEILADPHARAEYAKEFWSQVDEGKRAAQAAVIEDGSVPDRFQIFDMDVLDATNAEGFSGRWLGIFAQWLAIPQVHDLPLQITALTKPDLKRPGQPDVGRRQYYVAIPHGRALPSGKGLRTVLDAVNAAERAKAESLGVTPNFWFGRDAVILPNPANGGSLLTPAELSAVLNNDAHGLFVAPDVQVQQAVVKPAAAQPVLAVVPDTTKVQGLDEDLVDDVEITFEEHQEQDSGLKRYTLDFSRGMRELKGLKHLTAAEKNQLLRDLHAIVLRPRLRDFSGLRAVFDGARALDRQRLVAEQQRVAAENERKWKEQAARAVQQPPTEPAPEPVTEMRTEDTKPEASRRPVAEAPRPPRRVKVNGPDVAVAAPAARSQPQPTALDQLNDRIEQIETLHDRLQRELQGRRFGTPTVEAWIRSYDISQVLADITTSGLWTDEECLSRLTDEVSQMRSLPGLVKRMAKIKAEHDQEIARRKSDAQVEQAVAELVPLPQVVDAEDVDGSMDAEELAAVEAEAAVADAANADAAESPQIAEEVVPVPDEDVLTAEELAAGPETMSTSVPRSPDIIDASGSESDEGAADPALRDAAWGEPDLPAAGDDATTDGTQAPSDDVDEDVDQVEEVQAGAPPLPPPPPPPGGPERAEGGGPRRSGREPICAQAARDLNTWLSANYDRIASTLEDIDLISALQEALEQATFADFTHRVHEAVLSGGLEGLIERIQNAASPADAMQAVAELRLELAMRRFNACLVYIERFGSRLMARPGEWNAQQTRVRQVVASLMAWLSPMQMAKILDLLSESLLKNSINPDWARRTSGKSVVPSYDAASIVNAAFWKPLAAQRTEIVNPSYQNTIAKLRAFKHLGAERLAAALENLCQASVIGENEGIRIERMLGISLHQLNSVLESLPQMHPEMQQALLNWLTTRAFPQLGARPDAKAMNNTRDVLTSTIGKLFAVTRYMQNSRYASVLQTMSMTPDTATELVKRITDNEMESDVQVRDLIPSQSVRTGADWAKICGALSARHKAALNMLTSAECATLSWLETSFGEDVVRELLSNSQMAAYDSARYQVLVQGTLQAVQQVLNAATGVVGKSPADMAKRRMLAYKILRGVVDNRYQHKGADGIHDKETLSAPGEGDISGRHKEFQVMAGEMAANGLFERLEDPDTNTGFDPEWVARPHAGRSGSVAEVKARFVTLGTLAGAAVADVFGQLGKYLRYISSRAQYNVDYYLLLNFPATSVGADRVIDENGLQRMLQDLVKGKHGLELDSRTLEAYLRRVRIHVRQHADPTASVTVTGRGRTYETLWDYVEHYGLQHRFIPGLFVPAVERGGRR